MSTLLIGVILLFLDKAYDEYRSCWQCRRNRKDSMTVDHTLLAVIAVAGCVLLYVLIVLPIRIARQRKHPSADAIGLCVLFGFFFPPLWLIALVWACSVPAHRQTSSRVAKPYIPDCFR